MITPNGVILSTALGILFTLVIVVAITKPGAKNDNDGLSAERPPKSEWNTEPGMRSAYKVVDIEYNGEQIPCVIFQKSGYQQMAMAVSCDFPNKAGM